MHFLVEDGTVARFSNLIVKPVLLLNPNRSASDCGLYFAFSPAVISNAASR
jgi:hypothetical protein